MILVSALMSEGDSSGNDKGLALVEVVVYFLIYSLEKWQMEEK